MNIRDFIHVYKKYSHLPVVDNYITIETFGDRRLLWKGKICDLLRTTKSRSGLNKWIIVEMVVDYNHKREEGEPVYNKAKILRVI